MPQIRLRVDDDVKRGAEQTLAEMIIRIGRRRTRSLTVPSGHTKHLFPCF